MGSITWDYNNPVHPPLYFVIITDVIEYFGFMRFQDGHEKD